LTIALEQFPGTANVILHPGAASSSEVRLRLTDGLDRPLFLQARVEPEPELGGVLRVSILAPIWLVNKTGLPIVFKQEGYTIEAAGQDVEHEVARMGAPLMFAFMEEEGSQQALMMRVGGGLHPDGKATWCRHFYVESGANMRKLRVSPRDSGKAEWIYTVGIEVRFGKGRYAATQIVTLAPRFQLYNQSRHRITFAQKCFAIDGSSDGDGGAEATHLTALPQSSLAFHWPRLDREQLLCVRLLDVPGCQWSGGFRLEGVDSFQITVRDADGRGTFARVEVSLLGATFSVVISDAGDYPPPFRVDNCSEVSLTVYQAGVRDEALRSSFIKPHTMVPYAWDEPTLPPYLTVVAPGNSSATYNMDIIGQGTQVTYENFIYLAMSGTFSHLPSCESSSAIGGGLDGQNLVLDVEGVKVFLAKKEPGRRSQLWRMTPTGMLQHEGSSPPQEARRPTSVAPNFHCLVLDIAGPAVQPSRQIPLTLRKPDERRQSTQRWRFTDDGRMMCQHHGLFVQAKDGFMGMHRGTAYEEYDKAMHLTAYFRSTGRK